MIDAHFHCWQLSRADYGWLTPELGIIHRDVTVNDWHAQARVHQITGGLLVQAAPTVAETHFLLQQADAHPQVLGVVGWVDWLSPDVANQIRKLAQHPRLKGLRPMLQDLPDPLWMLQPQLTPALNALMDCQLVFDALVRTEHLAPLHQLMAQHSGLRVVVDHGAKPSPTQPLSRWLEPLKALADAFDGQRLACKLSGLWTELQDPHELGQLNEWVDALLEIWGPQRLIWGSDWPVLELSASYSQWRNWSLQKLQHLHPGDRAQILGLNAKRFYRL